MNPPFSVIFLTTLIGVGQGLYLALFGADLLARLGLTESLAGPVFQVAGSAVSLLFLGAGLLASFFHLGHPERAWRAAAMWRTSWLSRECIVLPAFMLTVLLYGAAHHVGAPGTAIGVIGAIGAILCIVLFVCTAMIYACIRFLQEWASPLTLVNYLLLGCASGFTLATGLAFLLAPPLARPYGLAAIVLTAAAFISRTASLYRNARIRPKSTLQSATGIHNAHLEQKSHGSMGGSFNTRQYFHGRKPLFLRSVKGIFLVLVFPLPALLLSWGLAGDWLLPLALAFLIQYLGLIAERWFFFAQANHPQNLYYQQIS